MEYFDKEGRRPLPGFVSAIGAILRVGGILILGTYAAYGILLLMNINPERLLKMDLPPDRYQELLLISQTIISSFQFLIFPVLYIFLYQRGLSRTIRFSAPDSGIFLLYALLLYMVFLPFLGKTIEWNQQLDLPEAFESVQRSIIEREKEAEKILDILVDADNTGEFLLILFVVAVLPGIGEELLFRGILQNELKWYLKNHHLAIWITAVCFSFIHFQFLGFIPRTLLGALFGYIYLWSGNLLLPMVLHFLHNASSLAVANYFKPPEGQAGDEVMAQNNWIAILFSLVFSSVFVYLSWKKYQERK